MIVSREGEHTALRTLPVPGLAVLSHFPRRHCPPLLAHLIHIRYKQHSSCQQPSCSPPGCTSAHPRARAARCRFVPRTASGDCVRRATPHTRVLAYIPAPRTSAGCAAALPGHEARGAPTETCSDGGGARARRRPARRHRRERGGGRLLAAPGGQGCTPPAGLLGPHRRQEGRVGRSVRPRQAGEAY